MEARRLSNVAGFADNAVRRCDSMDIAALSIGMNQAGLAQTLGVQILSMVQNEAETNSAQLVQMMQQMQQSVQPHLGASLDIRI